MPLDLTTLSAEARAHYIRTGRRYSSTDTFAQANLTLAALSTYAAPLAAQGFAADDVNRLTEARDALEAAGPKRETARTTKKETSAKLHKAARLSKDQRLRARTILMNLERVLVERNDTPARDAVRAIEAALTQTSTAGVDDDKLAAQLELLSRTFDNAEIAKLAKARGVDGVVADLQKERAELLAAAHEQASQAGTMTETEHLDVLDGVIVTLARAARRSARAAAKSAGEPAIAAAFELTAIDPPKPSNHKTATTEPTKPTNPV